MPPSAKAPGAGTGTVMSMSWAVCEISHMARGEEVQDSDVAQARPLAGFHGVLGLGVEGVLEGAGLPDPRLLVLEIPDHVLERLAEAARPLPGVYSYPLSVPARKCEYR